MEAGEFDVAPRPIRVEELLEEARGAAELVGTRRGVRLSIERPSPDAVVRAESAESAPDRGATLCFTLPRAESGTGA